MTAHPASVLGSWFLVLNPMAREKHMKLRKFLEWTALVFALLFLVQFAHFFRVCAAKPAGNQPDLIVVYGGLVQSSRHGLELAHQFNCPIYFSESAQTVNIFKNGLDTLGQPVTIDARAKTTDQNARYSASFIRNGGYLRVGLVCAWYHMPRALFLARLYLLGSKTDVVPYPNEPAPTRFWAKRDFWRDILRFWGSLGRVVLHWFGIDNWPQHQLLAGY
jgi:uncharacterized SAM-binding protein YcdF (DUF218 family)